MISFEQLLDNLLLEAMRCLSQLASTLVVTLIMDNSSANYFVYKKDGIIE